MERDDDGVWRDRDLTLHEFALREAERLNPGGEHVVTSVEIEGSVDEPGDAYVTVHSRVPCTAQLINIEIRPVGSTEDGSVG